MGFDDERKLAFSERESSRPEEILLFPPQIEIKNSSLEHDWTWNGLARIEVGRGYVGYSHDYMAKVVELAKKGEAMDTATYDDLVLDAADKMLTDPYGACDRARTFTGVVHDQRSTKHLGITARLVFGKENPEDGLQPLEVMELAEPEDIPWSTFYARRRMKLDTTCEIGRVVVPKEFRDAELTTPFVKQLLQGPGGIIETAQDQSMEHMVMIAQKRFAKHARRVLRFNGPYPIRLTDAGKETARKFPGYWNDVQDPPGLYVARIPAKIAV